MGIAEEVERRKQQSVRRRRCTVGQAIQEMGEDDFQAINYAIEVARQETEANVPSNKRLFSAPFIGKVMSDNGYRVGTTTVKDHLARKCCCDD